LGANDTKAVRASIAGTLATVPALRTQGADASRVASDGAAPLASPIAAARAPCVTGREPEPQLASETATAIITSAMRIVKS
jgi:hypothetical protein